MADGLDPGATAVSGHGSGAGSKRDCDAIVKKLNTRPRKRYDYDTPEERFHGS